MKEMMMDIIILILVTAISGTMMYIHVLEHLPTHG